MADEKPAKVPPMFRCHKCGKTSKLEYMPKISKKAWHFQKCPSCGTPRK